METQSVIELAYARRGHGVSAALRHLWGIVIRGAEDEPHGHYIPVLAPSLCGKARKGGRFRRTIERVARLIPPERLLTMLVRGETREFDADVAALGTRRLVQPAWRGGAAELFLAALRIARDDPHATIALLPWDHLADHEATFMDCVGRAARAVHARSDLVVVVGATASRAARGSAWIDAGDPIEGLEALAVRSVRRFVTRPSAGELTGLRQSGALLATRVLVAKVSTLLAFGRSRLPDVLEALEPLEEAAGPEEALLRDAVYGCMPKADVTSALGPHGDGFAVVPIPEFVEIEDGRRLPLAS
jgi:mannose-1-phosphate guanylyltransferase